MCGPDTPAGTAEDSMRLKDRSSEGRWWERMLEVNLKTRLRRTLWGKFSSLGETQQLAASCLNVGVMY